MVPSNQVWVPIPGFSPEDKKENAHGFAPRFQWCQFASSKPLEGGEYSSFSGKNKVLSDRRLRGAILVGVEWAVPDALGTPLRAAEERGEGEHFNYLDDEKMINNAIAPVLPPKAAPLSVGFGRVDGGYDTIDLATYKSPMKVLYYNAFNIPINLSWCTVRNGSLPSNRLFTRFGACYNQYSTPTNECTLEKPQW